MALPSTVSHLLNSVCQNVAKLKMSRYYLIIALAILSIPYSTANCSHLPKLLTLPGFGWDALTNNDTQQVWNFTYEQCKITDDGKFLIPDNTAGISLKFDDTTVVGEIIEHWNNYTAPDSHSMNTKIVSLPVEYLQLHASFSDEYAEMKKIRVENEAFTTRTQIRQTYYRIIAVKSISLTNDLKGDISEIIKAVTCKNWNKAEYLIQLLVQEYGTHYTKSVDVGAALIWYDYLPINFLRVNEYQRNKIVSAAKATILESEGFAWKNRSDLDISLLNNYKKFVLTRVVKKIGQTNWEKRLHDYQMARIDRSGEMLSGLISESSFPNLSSEVLTKIRLVLGDAINQYYKRNAHKGCTHQSSLSFDYAANIDYGYCKAATLGFCYNGAFQTCESSVSESQFCASNEFKNPLEDKTSCYLRDMKFRLYSRIISFNGNKEEIANVTTYACWGGDYDPYTGPDYYYPEPYYCSGFGGLYSSDTVNVITLERSCPPGFSGFVLFKNVSDLTICTIQAEAETTYEIPFGGFTNGRIGHRCPDGYKNVLAVKLDNDEIHYCLKKPDILNCGTVTSLLRPPYVNIKAALFHGPCLNLDEYDTEIAKPDCSNQISRCDCGTEIDKTNNTNQVNGCDQSKGYIFAGVLTVILLGLFALYYWQQDRINSFFGVRSHSESFKKEMMLTQRSE